MTEDDKKKQEMNDHATTKSQDDDNDDDETMMKNEKSDNNKNKNTIVLSPPTQSPLEAAAWRLEKSLTIMTTTTTGSGGSSSLASSSEYYNNNLYQFSNPAKRVRRWLSTSSGVASDATIMDIVKATQNLFPPPLSSSHSTNVDNNNTNPVLPLLLEVVVQKNNNHDDDDDDTMKVDSKPNVNVQMQEEEEEENDNNKKKKKEYLTTSVMEVQVWLLSLKARLLWRQSQQEQENDSQQAVLLLTKAVLYCRTGIAWMTQYPFGFTTTTTTNQMSTTMSSSCSSHHPLLARLWRFLVLILLDESHTTTTTTLDLRSSLRSELAQAHNTALLRRDLDTSATLLNCMLRELLFHSQVEQAQKLLSNSTFPSLDGGSSNNNNSGTLSGRGSSGGSGSSSSSSSSSMSFHNNNQLCRYLYYCGRIQALRLDYTNSFANLTQSLRKAPTNTALGFRIAVQRLLIVVQLLMGEIPDRTVFYFTKTITTTTTSATTTDKKNKENRTTTMTTSKTQDKEGGENNKTMTPTTTPETTTTTTRRQQLVELEPYLHITQAVRHGDLAVFTKVVSQHKQQLQVDETFTLISRLAHEVIKAGLRKLQTSYIRLSLQDVAQRLGLSNAQQAEFVVAKAIRDGVLEATTIDHTDGYVQSLELQNIYTTKEPAHAFHRRIAYCLTTHNDAIRAMRYPPDAYKKQLEASRSGSQRRRKGDADQTDEEKAQEMEDELEEDY